MTATTSTSPAAGPRFQFVPFADLANWSVRLALETSFHYNPVYPLRPLGSFLQQVKDEVTIEDQTTYQRITVRGNNRGVVPRDTAIGRNIGTKRQFRVMPGHFLLSRIDARHGAMGLVPPVLAGTVVTADFPVFKVDQAQMNSDFLVLITSTREFIRFCQSYSSGTTNRQRLDTQSFLNVKVPLPSLPEQARLVADYHTKTRQAQQKRTESERAVKDADAFLLAELGMSLEAKVWTTGKLQFTNFTDLDRWDAAHMLRALEVKSAYPEAKLEGFIAHFMRDADGSSVRMNTSDFATQTFLYVGMENVEKHTGKLAEAPTVEGKEIKSQTLRVPPGFFIYGKLRPYLNKYWRNTNEQKNVICSSEFFIFSLNDRINADYFVTVLRSEIVQRQIQGNTSGIRMPRMSESAFLGLRIPLPEIAKQAEIAEVFKRADKNRDTLEATADQLEAAAISQFEEEVFETNVNWRKA
jgi:type I restriction enzyme S subunit